MNNIWIVARHEYLIKVTKKGFWLASLSIPVLIIVAMAVAIIFALRAGGTDPIGYVDQAGLIIPGSWQPVSETDTMVETIAYQDEDAARAALDSGEVKAYYVVPADYLSSPNLDLYYLEDTPGMVQRESFENLLRASLASDSPVNVQNRILEGPKLTVTSMDHAKEINQGNVIGILLPFAAGIILVITNMTSANTLLQVVADEKENRTIEILLTTITPEQLIGGKVIGLMGVTFTQLALWAVTVIIGIIVGNQMIPSLQGTQIPWDFMLLALLFFVPTFALISGIMTAIGGSVTELNQGQQISGVLNLLFMLPLMLSALILMDPNSPIVTFMTLFPTTSFSTIVLRWGFSVIPTWELIVSWIILTVFALFSVWASARIFRMGMLRYGKALDLRTAISGLWNRGASAN